MPGFYALFEKKATCFLLSFAISKFALDWRSKTEVVQKQEFFFKTLKSVRFWRSFAADSNKSNNKFCLFFSLSHSAGGILNHPILLRFYYFPHFGCHS